MAHQERYIAYLIELAKTGDIHALKQLERMDIYVDVEDEPPPPPEQVWKEVVYRVLEYEKQNKKKT